MKKIIHLLFFIILFSCSTKHSSDDRKESLISRFENAYGSGQWQEALNYIDTLRTLKVNLFILPIEAECYAGLGQHEKAISMLENEIRLDTMKNIYYIHSALGNVYSHKNEYNIAIEHYKKSIKLRPTYARPYINIGDIYMNFNKIDSCVYYYLSAIELFAENRFFNEVIDFSHRVISLDSLNLDGYKFLQYGYQSQGQYKNAVSVGLKLDEILSSKEEINEKQLNRLFTGLSAYKCSDYLLSYELIYSSIQAEEVRSDYGWLAFCYLSAIQNKLGDDELAKEYADYAMQMDSDKTTRFIKELLEQ